MVLKDSGWIARLCHWAIKCVDCCSSRACGAAGSAPAWHAGGQGFKSPQVHKKISDYSGIFLFKSVFGADK